MVEQQLVSAVGSYSAPGARYPNLFVISAAPRFPHTAAEVELAIEKELQRLADEPVTEMELQRIQKRLRTDTLRSLGSNDGLASMLSYYESIAGSWRYLVDYEKQIGTVSAAEILAVAKDYFKSSNRTLVVLAKEEQK